MEGGEVAPDGVAEALGGVGFLHEAGEVFGAEAVAEVAFVVARGEDYRHGGVDPVG